MGQPSKEAVSRYRNKPEVRERMALYQRAYAARRREEDPEGFKARNRQKQRRGHLKRKFGLTLEQYDSLLNAQNNLCAICKSPNQASRDWHVDHCHTTGTVRGVLCHHCNLMLGYAKDQVPTLENAIIYLRKGLS
jgi:hypothetical protein